MNRYEKEQLKQSQDYKEKRLEETMDEELLEKAAKNEVLSVDNTGQSTTTL